MLKFQNQLRIRRSPEYIFKVLSDLENLPVWQIFDMQVRQASPGEPGLGTTYHLDRKGERRTLRISQFEPGERLGVETVERRAPRVSLLFDLLPEGPDHTLLSADWSVESGLPAIMEKMAAGKVRSLVDANLDKLKELLETGRTTLPDGSQLHLPEP